MIELLLKQRLITLPNSSLAVRPLVVIELTAPPIIDEFLVSQEIELSHPPIIDVLIEQKETQLPHPPTIDDSQEKLQIQLLQPPIVVE